MYTLSLHDALPIAIRNDRFGFAELREHDDDLAALDLLHFTRQELADLVGELFPDTCALTLAHALDDTLLRGLHRRATEGIERHLLFQHISHLEVRILEARFLERHLRARVLHGLHHGAEHRDPDRAFELVDADLGPHVGTVALDEGGVQPVLEQVEQLRPLELLGVRQLANRRDYITGIRRHGFLVTNPPPNARREFRPAAPAAALPPGARARPSPRRERPRCAPARARAPPPSPEPRGPRTAPNADASARVVRAPGSTPRACSGVPADRPRRATPRAPGSPWHNRPPLHVAVARWAAIRCALERAAGAACRRCGGRPVRGPTRPSGPETTRRACRRA